MTLKDLLKLGKPLFVATLTVSTLLILFYTNTTSSEATIKEQIVQNGRIKVELPERPFIWEVHPELFDEKTLKRLKEEHQSIESAPIEIKQMIPQKNLHSIRDFLGFRGPLYATEVDGKSVNIIIDSLRVNKEGNWNVMGLIRNETTKKVGEVTVTAVLRSEDGSELEKAYTIVPVGGIRPGEPAPFSIDSSTPINEVASIDWSVDASPGNDISRNFDVRVYDQIPYGVNEYKGIPREDKSYPYVLSTGIRNYGQNINTAKLVVAWLNQNNEVVWIETTSLSEAFSDGVKQDGSANFKDIVIEDKKIGSLLNNSQYMIWVVGE